MTVNRLLHVTSRWMGVVALAAAGACNDMLEVASPSRIDAGSLENPTNAQLLVTGAIADFECAFGAYVVAGGCKSAGCPTHLACNPKSERCESIGCTPAGPACPPGSLCETRTHSCQTQPPPPVLPER